MVQGPEFGVMPNCVHNAGDVRTGQGSSRVWTHFSTALRRLGRSRRVGCRFHRSWVKRPGLESHIVLGTTLPEERE